MSQLKKTYIGTEKCGLCRLQLPWGDLMGLDAWEYTFRAALCLDSDDENTVEITGLANLSNVHDEIDVTLTGYQGNQSVTVAHYQQKFRRRQTNPTAFCFHGWCYEILRQKVRSCTKSEIYKLARTLSLDSVAWENGYRDNCQSGSISNQMLADLADNSVAIFNLLPGLFNLPAELRNNVWEYVGLKTAISASILVAEETSRLARSLTRSGCKNISLDRGSHISLKMITVFGTAYIQDLNNGESPKVIPGVVTRLSFAMVLGGICAIKLFGTDWDTGWLGKIPNTGRIWYGTIQEMGAGLTCSYNDLYCTSISSSGSSPTNQILWDQSDFPTSLSNPEATLFDFNRDIIGSSHLIQNSQPRCFGYLPLFSGDEYVSGLTVYLSGNGIIGLEAHFTQTSRLLGSCDGCSKYLPLDPSERIAFTWLRIINSRSRAHAAPTLTIQTTLGRIYSFGPYILPQLVASNKYKWVLLNKSGILTGFYFEKPIASSVIMRLGITRDKNSGLKEHLNLQYPACNPPHLPLVGPNAGLFLSVAVLSCLKKVELCRLGSRCTGIRMHYLTTPPVVLGQWHTSYPSQHTSIYNGNGLDTYRIYFKISKSSGHQVVTDVSFSMDKSDDHDYSCFSSGKPIAWWFSKFDDMVHHWEEKFITIPEESMAKFK